MKTDPNNWGACGHVCNAPNVQQSGCSNGACVVQVCSPGFANCNGVYADGCETNIQNDPNNCGGCGKVCLPGSVCQNATCCKTTWRPCFSNKLPRCNGWGLVTCLQSLGSVLTCGR